MKFGYKYYQGNFIKLAILSVGCLPTFWDHFRGNGNPKDEPGALILVAAIAVGGNIWLFSAMRRAKRREQAEISQTRISGETPAA